MVKRSADGSMANDSETDELPTRIEYLYGIEAGHEELNDWIPTRIIRFRVIKKTARRIYYNAHRPERLQAHARFVDRAALERDGEVRRSSAGWWEPDGTVYLQPPVLEEPVRPSLSELKTRMAAAHPDRGGDQAAFIAAHTLYERAKAKAKTCGM